MKLGVSLVVVKTGRVPRGSYSVSMGRYPFPFESPTPGEPFSGPRPVPTKRRILPSDPVETSLSDSSEIFLGTIVKKE